MTRVKARWGSREFVALSRVAFARTAAHFATFGR